MSIPSHYSSTQKHNLSAHRITIPSHAEKSALLSGRKITTLSKCNSNFAVRISAYVIGILVVLSVVTFASIEFFKQQPTSETPSQLTLNKLPHADIANFSSIVPDYCELKSATPMALQYNNYEPVPMIKQELLCPTEENLAIYRKNDEVIKKALNCTALLHQQRTIAGPRLITCIDTNEYCTDYITIPVWKNQTLSFCKIPCPNSDSYQDCEKTQPFKVLWHDQITYIWNGEETTIERLIPLFGIEQMNEKAKDLPSFTMKV